MEELCGSGRGWTRLAYLDMINSTENSLSGFKLHHQEELELVRESNIKCRQLCISSASI